MKEIATVTELLPADTTAIVLFTEGKNFEIGDSGVGHTGAWHLNPDRRTDTVIIYFRGKSVGDNTLYQAEPAGVEGPNEEKRYWIKLANIREVGTTRSNWHVFIGKPTNNPVFYVGHEDRTELLPAAVTNHLLQLLRREFPGWESVTDPRFVAEEIDYKRAAATQAQEMLSAAELQQLLDARDHEGFVKRLETVAHSTNLLWLSVPRDGDLSILYHENLDPAGFSHALFGLLHGPEPVEERLDRYLNYLGEHDLPSRWAFPTYFLFLLYPEEEIFVKPSTTQWFLEQVGDTGVYQSTPSVPIYQRIRARFLQLRDSFAEYGVRDMIDVQSIVWPAHQHSKQQSKPSPGRQLAQPFATIFSSYEEAEQVFEFFAETARKVGLRGEQDDRFALTLRHNQRVLRLNFGNWMLVDYNGREKGHLNLALLSELVPPEYEMIDWGPSFARTERPVQLFMLPLDLALNMPPDLSVAYEESMSYLSEYFLHWGGSTWRSSNQQALFAALFDDDKRDALLTGGIPVSPGEQPPEPSPREPYTTTDFLDRTHLLPETMDELLALLRDKRQIVLYGPPGTGKTYVARELGRLLTGQAAPLPEQLALIQFHPAYGYEDFMEGIRPRSQDAGDGRFVVDYPVERGIFRRFCETAREVDGPAVLIVDEINRGNIARIFGELMFLLEYRDAEIILPYSGDRFSIPENVYLIGTMNTADRSIALVDFALRRRFHFYPFRADAELLARWLESHPVDIPYLLPLYRRLSEDAIDDPDYAIGPSYFMDKSLTEEKLRRIWERSIIPYLAEYHLDQRQSVDGWRWDADLVRTIRERHDSD
jgi:5-methylcytosine-specific restriction enzyme B